MGWADVSYFSEIQWGCPVGSLPRPRLWNALTHSWRANRRDRQTARKYVWHRNCVYTWHTYTGSVIHCAWLCFFHTVSFQGTFFMPFCPLFRCYLMLFSLAFGDNQLFSNIQGVLFITVVFHLMSKLLMRVTSEGSLETPGVPRPEVQGVLVASACVKGTGNDFQVTGGESTKGSMNQCKRVG